MIALIAILLSIMLPSLHFARRSSRNTVCQTNLRQIAVGFHGYALNHKGEIWPIDHSKDKYWMDFIEPYTSERDEIRMCPETQIIERPENVDGTGHAHGTWKWGPSNEDGSYGMNLWLTPWGVYQNDPLFERDHYFYNTKARSMTSDVPLYADARWVGGWPESHDIVPTDLKLGHNQHADGYQMGRFALDRHSGGTNLVFFDSSVRWVKLTDLWKQKWHKNFTPTDVVID